MVATELADVARDHHAAHPAGPTAARIGLWLGALVPRVMHPGGWTSAARVAGAEPLLTGRTRVYDESTLRQAADQLDAEGCSARVAKAAAAKFQGVRPREQELRWMGGVGRPRSGPCLAGAALDFLSLYEGDRPRDRLTEEYATGLCAPSTSGRCEASFASTDGSP